MGFRRSEDVEKKKRAIRIGMRTAEPTAPIRSIAINGAMADWTSKPGGKLSVEEFCGGPVESMLGAERLFEMRFMHVQTPVLIGIRLFTSGISIVFVWSCQLKNSHIE